MSCGQDYRDHASGVITLNGKRYYPAELVEEKFISTDSSYTIELQNAIMAIAVKEDIGLRVVNNIVDAVLRLSSKSVSNF